MMGFPNNVLQKTTPFTLPSPLRHSHKRPLSSGGPPGRAAAFPSYTDVPTLSPKIKLLCEILATTPSSTVESSLDDSGVRVTPEDVEEVLKLSYSHPATAVKFFRWSGHRHSPYSWNLMVDLLGKNLLFDAMWDSVKSMLNERLLSLATFASSSGATSPPGGQERRSSRSIRCAICRDGRTVDAKALFDRAKAEIRPDADTYAILLEGWENEVDAGNGRRTFSEMVADVGWDPRNVPAYDSFLTALVRAPSPVGGVSEAMKFLEIMTEERCSPGPKFFRTALGELVRLSDARGALALWESMVRRHACYPDTGMYNEMIALQCYVGQVELGMRFFEEMVFYPALPDAQTYNVLLKFLLKGKKLGDAAMVFKEMMRNECPLDETNCHLAMRAFLDAGEVEAAIGVWKFMLKNGSLSLEEAANRMVVGLRDCGRLPEACRYSDDAIERGIKLYSSTLSKLKGSLQKLGKMGERVSAAAGRAGAVPSHGKQVKAARPAPQKKDGSQVAASDKKGGERPPEKDRKKDVPHPRMQFDDQHRVEKAKRRAVVNQSEARNRVELFRHLPQYVHGTQLPDLESKFFQIDPMHSAVYKSHC
ncbi:Pentatricopeptide repeat-containing protein [Acorus calamus]|uniref:Pentatricopeptide repeat-containing protein n=1 Tax=Acorus calamus TaxID=4465 RepID=A0AAV9DK06_ACOCL|nr:Pentatricopeptide repeat-containing protein [Acorus calamus]